MDINYLFLRQQTEKSRAATATSDIARKIHEQLADHYERLIEQATNGRISFIPAELHVGAQESGTEGASAR